MSDIQHKIREQARKVLADGSVSVVVGWGAGSVAFKTTPVFIDKPEDVDKLVWNPACVNNLAVYLPKLARDNKGSKIGVVAKPCDIRSIVQLTVEKQVKREDLYIIGLGCQGVIDAEALEGRDFRMQEITALGWDGDGLKVTTGTAECTLPRAECLRAMCELCTKRTPVISDVEIGEPAPPDEANKTRVPELPEERRKFWAAQFGKCVRCYACRQTCPNCYCESCFADRIEPKWTAKKPTADEAWMFHATRTMHIAGRCVSCGECDRVCPVGIPLSELTREMNETVKEKYGYEAGEPSEESPLLGQYRENDIDPAHHVE